MRTGTELTNRIVVPRTENGAVLIRLAAASAGSLWAGRRTGFSRSPREALGKPVLTLARPHRQDSR